MKRWYVAPVVIAALVMWSCSEDTRHPAGPETAPPEVPLFGAVTPANGGGACMGDDSWAGGLTPGMQSASDLNCDANDIEIAIASVSEYRFTDPALPGGSWSTLAAGSRIECTPGQDIWVRTAAQLQNNAQARYDIGIWIGTQGQATALNGQCSHYNLVKTGAGVSDLDGNPGDVCGDMSANSGLATIDLDVLKVSCTDPNNDGTVEVPACIGWQNQVNGAERVCASNDPALQFRYKTTPDNKAKCNCDPLVLPIDVRSVLRIKKATVPAGNTTDFTFTPSGWNSNATFTRKDTEGAFASAPLASGSYSVAETVPAGWTLTDRACVLTATSTAKTFSNVTNGVSVNLTNGEDVTCTFTNTKAPRISVAKVTAPTSDGGKFDFSIGGTGFDNSGAGYGHGQNTGFQQVSVGVVTVSESAHSGTTLSNYTSTLACINAADQAVTVSTNTGTSGSVTVAAGDDIRCTFTNARKPELRVLKATVPTSDAGKFDFTIGATGFNNGGAGYGNGEGTAFQVLSAGAVTVSEAAHSGTTLGNYTSALACTNASQQSVTVSTNTGTSGSVTLAAGDQITCTFTNTRKPEIKVVKATVPTSDPGTFDFNIGGTGFNNSGAGYGNGDDTGFQQVAIGSVTIIETGHAGTTLATYTSALTCVNAAQQPVTVSGAGTTTGSVTVAAGDQITCTFTNTKQATVRVAKATVPTSDPGKFDFNIGGTGFNNGNAGYGNGQNTGFQVVSLGSVAISETAHSGTTLSNYSSTLACVNAAQQSVTVTGAGTTSGSITVAAGDQISCTFTNTRIPEIRVLKATVPTSDGGKFDFNIGATQFTNGGAGYGNGQGTAFQQVTAGPVSISEAAHAGTTLSNYSSALACVNASQQSVTVGTNTGASGSVTVAAGDQITCTFTNTRLGTMILQKVFVGTPVSFSFTGTGPNGSISTNNGTITVNNVAPGTYTSDETPVAGWILSALDCNDANSTEDLVNGIATYRVEAGETVTCTFTNTELATLIISKVIGGSVSAITSFGFSAVAGTTPSIVSTINLTGGQSNNSGKVLTPGTYTVCEVNVPVALDVSATLDGNPTALADHDPQAAATNLCLQVVLSAGQTRTVVYTNSLIVGEGGTRTIGYWKNWSSCTGGNQYTKAQENDIVNLTLDGNIGAGSSVYPLGLIADGTLDCLEAFNLLSKTAVGGQKRPGDPIYNMVAQLLGAKLNQNAGAAPCDALNDATTGALKLAQDLLIEVDFDGTNSYPKKGANALTADQISRANTLNGILTSYNEGTLGGGCPTHA